MFCPFLLFPPVAHQQEVPGPEHLCRLVRVCDPKANTSTSLIPPPAGNKTPKSSRLGDPRAPSSSLGAGSAALQPSPEQGHGSVQSPPSRPRVNRGKAETFSSKYLVLGKIAEECWFVSAVQNCLGLYLLRHRGGERTCESWGMLPSSVLSGGTFRVQPTLGQRSRGQHPHPVVLCSFKPCPRS